MIIDCIIPAYNEENSIPLVLQAIPSELVREVVVIDNASTDKTASVAAANGAKVLSETRKGYGSACLKGIEYIQSKEKQPEVVVFLDADYSDFPEQMPDLLQPIQDNQMDMVVGSRALGNREKGSMTIPQLFGNWLATHLLKLFYGAKFTDLGPFRAIRFPSLLALDMQDTSFGWTVEMQIKAVKQKMSYTEVAVDYRNRIGVSKISGTIKGAILAGYKIIWTLLKYR
ncbi:MAG: glycosyltransferase family 2 protein [Cyclobacteriaceae bacterium]